MAERTQIGMAVQFQTTGCLDRRRTQHTNSELHTTTWHGRILLMDKEIQFAETDEHRYHEMLVHPAIAASSKLNLRVLILGGGDGLAAREVLRWRNVHSVTIVDYDAEFVRQVAEPLLFALNNDAFKDPRVRAVFENAVTFTRNTRDEFDVIFIDLPDPDDNQFAQLYHDLLYSCQNCLADGGVLAMHTGGMSLNPRHPSWSFLQSLRTTARHVYGVENSRLHFRTAHIPSFVHPWGFFYITPRKVFLSPNVPVVSRLCKYYDPIRLEHTLVSQSECIGDKDIVSLYEEFVEH